MGQVLTEGKPGLPATDHGDLDVFSHGYVLLM